MRKPNLIFKYRSLVDERAKERFLDVVKNHRVFFANPTKLNDPFEGCLSNISMGVAGSSIYAGRDQLHPYLVERINHTRVLALSEDCFSTDMWAHYASEYDGVCLCFRTDRAFSNIQKVQYSNENNSDMIFSPSPETVDNLLDKALLIKSTNWTQEKEWRIIRHNTEDNYIQFKYNELVAVIFGHKVNENQKNELMKQIPDECRCFITYPGTATGTLHLIKNGYRIPADGTTPDFIDSVDELYKRLLIK